MELLDQIVAWFHRAIDALDFGAGGAVAELAPDESHAPENDPVVSRDYPNLRTAPREMREALAEVASAVGVNPADLSDIIQSESEWDPTQPKKETGTPRAGLLQLTVGANQPGYRTAAEVWALRQMPGDRQLREVFLPFLRGLKLPKGADAYRIYKGLFLPRFASQGAEFAVCDLNDARSEDDKWCRANPGFDRNKDGRIQWLEVFERVNEVRRQAKGKWLTLSGKVVDGPAEPGVAPAGNTGIVPPASGPASGTSSGPATPAPAILKLRDQINERWPSRPKASDGILGDKAHQARKSDHNDGNAIDITRGPGGPDTRQLVQVLLRDPRIAYAIHESQIWNPAIEGGRARPYKGPTHARHVHFSIKAAAREDTTPWDLDGVDTLEVAGGGGNAQEAIRRGLVWAMDRGLVDNVVWVPLPFKDLVITTSAEFLSVEGVRIPLSWAEELELCRRMGWVPSTVAVVDRRWELADRRLILNPKLPIALNTDKGVEQVLQFNQEEGPVTPAVLAEGPKRWVCDQGATVKSPVNYGLFRADGTVWQSPGHKHDPSWKDYSQLEAPVARRALWQGQEIDLVARMRSSGKYDTGLLDFLEGK